MVGVLTQINLEHPTDCTVSQTKDSWSIPSARFGEFSSWWRTRSIVVSSCTFLSPDWAARLFDFLFKFFTVPWTSIFSRNHAPSFYKVLYLFEDVQELGMNFIKPLFLKFLLRTPASLFHSPHLSTVTARLSSNIIQKILGLM